MNSTRRYWLSTCLATTAWAEIASALEHAHATSKSVAPPAFETLDSEAAAEIEAIAAQIIPSADGPGAREAGVIYFIDRALSTFDADKREAYYAGMGEIQQRRKELFPSSTSISSLTNEQQIELIHAIEHSAFFELLRTHTVMGFLGNPSYGGNRSGVGWEYIGFEDRMAFQPPFGYYDEKLSGPSK
ncbi:MAG TPA: gluconate 2-dehydrogenase subunit 3 family protein [Bryobacteraceae bacterium]|jgi:gluconate 2-dehydrogenase gamma chain